MNTYSLHFKWTVSRGRETYGYNICTLYVDGINVGRCLGGGYDMQGTLLAQWLVTAWQTDLLTLFASDFTKLETDSDVRTYTEGGETIKCASPYPDERNFERYYGATLFLYPSGKRRVSLDGACGFSSMERIGHAIGLSLKWNKESARYKNHTYYTAIYNPQTVDNA